MLNSLVPELRGRPKLTNQLPPLRQMVWKNMYQYHSHEQKEKPDSEYSLKYTGKSLHILNFGSRWGKKSD
jgi:hypothetical protein